MAETSEVILKVVASLVLVLGLEILAEAFAGFVVGNSETFGLRWLHNRWWAQKLYRRTNATWLIPIWLVAAITIVAAWHAMTVRSDWVAALGLSLFFAAPLLAVGVTAWWLRSPFRHKAKR